jgi:heme-degrading monooxygenase HmoA
MIARTWRGATRAADADAYVAYLNATGLQAYRDTPGNRGAFCFRRIVGDRAEFVTLSLWESEAAVQAFAGKDIGRAVYGRPVPGRARHARRSLRGGLRERAVDRRVTGGPQWVRRRRSAGESTAEAQRASEADTRAP